MSITGNVRTGTRLLAGAIGLALAFAAPAAAAPKDAAKSTKKAAANPLGCIVDHALSTPFRAWNDTADYALAPAGDFEGDTSAWTLSGAAAVVEGNQPFDIGTDRKLVASPARGQLGRDRADVHRQQLSALPAVRAQHRDAPRER